MIVFDFNHSIERKPVLRFISPPWWCSTWPTNLAWCACWRMQRDGPILLSWSLTWQWSPSPSFTFENTGDPAKSLKFNSLECMDMGGSSLTIYCPMFDLNISGHTISNNLQDAFCLGCLLCCASAHECISIHSNCLVYCRQWVLDPEGMTCPYFSQHVLICFMYSW